MKDGLPSSVVPFDRKGRNSKPLDTRNGHETILKGFIVRREPIELNLMNGKRCIGRVTQFDNYTITIALGLFEPNPKTEEYGFHFVEEGGLRTFFKHCIESFGVAVHKY